jgi:CRP-like cAMP-binding protein
VVIDGSTSAPSNRLLEALSRVDRNGMLRRCELVNLAFAEVLFNPGDRIKHVYFPLDSVVSLVASLDSRPRLEVALVGSEGMIGTSLLLGTVLAPFHGVVQGGGTALRMPAALFVSEIERGASLRRGLGRYVEVLLNQLALTAICVRFHTVEERLARWLLISRDRAKADDLRFTQAFLGYMLGVRREGVSEAGGILQKRGLIRYSRGAITILDQRGLEKTSCTCYDAAKKMYAEILS